MSAPPLTRDETVAAVKDLLVTYPQIIRSDTDPAITNQNTANISFLLLKEPKLTKSGKPVYGLMKVRGVWPNPKAALDDATRIISEVDSKNKIYQPPVGQWVPITADDAFVLEKHDVNADGATSGPAAAKEQVHLRDAAAKDREANERKIMRELNERQAELETTDVYDGKETQTLTYYTMRRVTELRIREEITILRNKLEKLRNDTLKTVRDELTKIETSHSEYDDLWLAEYNKERRKAGIPDYRPSDNDLAGYRVPLNEIESLLQQNCNSTARGGTGTTAADAAK